MKAILFDFGGTIDTDGVHWSEKFSGLYARFAPEVPKQDVERAFLESDRVLLADASVAQLTFEATLERQWRIQFELLGLEASGSLFEEMSRTCYDDVRRTIARAKETLLLLAPRYRLGVVSNFTGNLEIVCREFGLEKLFSAFIDSAVVGVRKPDPAIFALALERLRLPGAMASVVGDSYDRDIVPAKKLGCSTVWLKGRSWNTPPATDAADRTIRTFSEIQDIFLH